MRTLDIAKAAIKLPSDRHEFYQVNPWCRKRGSILNKRPADQPCISCGHPIEFGLEIAARLKGSMFRGREFIYIHRMCLRIEALIKGAS